MKKFLVFITFLSVLQLQSQTEQDIVKEANRLNVSSRDQAINALSSKGISLAQAKKMAQLRGIDFDTFLDNYLKSNSTSAKVNTTPLASDVVTDLKVVAPPEVIIDTLKLKPVIEKEIKNYFGYDIFVNNPFGEKDYLLGNIDEGYILAPGDELRITVFGDNNLELVSKIDLNGNISVPNLGVFFAAGNSFATLKKRIKIFLGKYYSGLLATPTRTFLDVSLTQIRPVKVSVLGNVNTPGPHLVNGMATVLNALYASGGIKTSGSLRAVKVYRNNKLIKTIDLYDYITQGNIDQDIRLSNNDVLFVGPRISSITLKGNVKKASIFELTPSETLKDLFKYAGGLNASASLKSMNISRIKPFKDREQSLVFDRFLTTVDFTKYNNNSKNKFVLTDGDVVSVGSVLEKQKNQVSIAGNVNNPGTYALDVYTDLKDLIIRGAKGLKPNTYLEKIDINKEDEKGVLSYQTYNLQDVLQGVVKVSLNENDAIKIYSLTEVEGAKTVSISGFGVAAKTLALRENLSLFDIIFQSVSLEELDFQSKVLTSRVDVKRFDENSNLYEVNTFSLEDLTTLKATFLQAKDQVILYSKSVSEDLLEMIEVLGSVQDPGAKLLTKKMYVEDAILAAGGFLDNANQTEVMINRKDRNVVEGIYSTRTLYTLDLDYLKGLSKVPSNPYLLQNYDVISVTTPLRAGVLPKITVTGEVNTPSSLVLESDRLTLNEALELSGGLTKNSYIQSSYILRDSLKLYVNFENKKSFRKDLFLDGDKLVVGSKLEPIITSGAVNFPSVFNWDKVKRAKYYIRKSGGKKERIAAMYVTHLNGESQKISTFNNPKIYPGSIITLEQKPGRVGDNGEKLDKFIRVFSILTGTLTTILLATKI